ncbi:hypothetical protein NFI96_000680 [Prochilodus magdalenae]|nr:hypothetical protein NFI96_000680 [Prochilodus magdalenae]
MLLTLCLSRGTITDPLFGKVELSKMAAHWRRRTSALVVTLWVLHCWGWVSCHVERTSEKSPMSHERVKRGWVWNQFFVVEEYTGTEPLYVGKWCQSYGK